MVQRAHTAPASLTVEELRALQERFGNQAAGQILADAATAEGPRHSERPSPTPTASIQRTPGNLPPEVIDEIKRRRRMYNLEEAEEEQRAIDTLHALAELPGAAEDLFEEDEKKDDASKVTFDDVYGVTTGTTGLLTGTATTARLGADTGIASSHVAQTGNWDIKNAGTTPGGASGAITTAAGVQSAVGVGKGVYDWYKARKKRKGSGPATEQQLGWKEEKDAAKAVGTGTLGTLQSGVTATSQFAAQAGAGWAGNLTQFGVGPAAIATGLIGVGRGAYGGGRATGKAIKIGRSRGKLKKSMRQLGQQAHDEQDPHTRAGLEQKLDKQHKLKNLMAFAAKRKGRKAGENALTATSGGLAAAGGFLTATGIGAPVALGLFAGSAAIGLGAGAWKAGKGLYKRGRRIHKMRKLQQQMGEKRDWKWGARQFFWGKMDKKREKTAALYEKHLEQHQGDADQRAALAEQLRHATQTSKQRSARDLVELLTDDDADVRAHARSLAHKLSVVTKDGKVKKSRGFKFWRKKKEIDVEEAIKREGGKENLEKLFERKLKAGL